ncbi:MAG TPA: NRDE family protein [Burkholderiales bacterium]
MCLIVAAWRVHPDWPLIVAANRDEFHGRPASPAGFWSDRPHVLGGRDLQAKGTWMAVSRAGRFAAVTNYRGAHEPSAAESRGALVTRFLDASSPAAEYVRQVVERQASYSGYNLLACDGRELWWTSNRDSGPRRLEPGCYALGNLLLDSPDVLPLKERAREVIDAAPGVEPLFSLTAAARIVGEQYGTRCSTVCMIGETIRYAERSFAPDGAEGETVYFELSAQR